MTRYLIVSDDSDFRSRLATRLDRYADLQQAALNPQAILEVLRTYSISAILIDLRERAYSPRTSLFVRWLQVNPQTRSLSIVAVTDEDGC